MPLSEFKNSKNTSETDKKFVYVKVSLLATKFETVFFLVSFWLYVIVRWTQTKMIKML